MIEQVEELRSELNTHSLAQISLLEDSEIKVVDSRSTKDGINPRFGARSPIWWGRKAARVEPLAQVAPAGFPVASGNNARSNVRDSKVRGFQWGRARVSNLQRETALESGDAIDAPTGNYAIGQPAHARQVFSAMTERKVQNVADDESL